MYTLVGRCGRCCRGKRGVAQALEGDESTAKEGIIIEVASPVSSINDSNWHQNSIIQEVNVYKYRKVSKLI